MRTLVLVRDPAEALDLVPWAARLTAGQGPPAALDVVCVARATGASRTEVEDPAAPGDHPVLAQVGAALRAVDPPPQQVRLRLLADPRPEEAALAEVQEVGPDLVVAGAGADEERGTSWARLARECATDLVVLRPALEPRPTPSRVLVATAGGRHARVALRLADGLAAGGASATALAVMSPAADAEEAGARLLARALREAGADPARVTAQVAVADRAGVAIAAEAQEHDLVLLGASDDGLLERLLQGQPVPDRVLASRPRHASVGVVRAAPAFARRTVARLEAGLGRWVRRLDREERLELHARLEAGSRWRPEFMAMLGLATGLAALGLLQSSTAVVIGAMLVAPLMTPMLGAGLGIAQGNPQLASRAAAAVIRGTVLAIAIGALFGVLGGDGELTPELAARTAPSLSDLFVAALSGVAAAYALSRPELGEALPGVAIAAALVPPLATTGISASMGALEAARGAALLYATNLVVIILAAAVVFRLAGMRPDGAGRPWASTTLLVLLLVAGALAIPLSAALVERLARRDRAEADVEDGVEVDALRPPVLRRLRQVVAREPGAVLVVATRAGPGEVVLVVALDAAAAPDAVARIASAVAPALDGDAARVLALVEGRPR